MPHHGVLVRWDRNREGVVLRRRVWTWKAAICWLVGHAWEPWDAGIPGEFCPRCYAQRDVR